MSSKVLEAAWRSSVHTKGLSQKRGSAGTALSGARSCPPVGMRWASPCFLPDESATSPLYSHAREYLALELKEASRQLKVICVPHPSYAAAGQLVFCLFFLFPSCTSYCWGIAKLLKGKSAESLGPFIYNQTY